MLRQLLGKDAKDQANIDKIMIELDGTENKSTSRQRHSGGFLAAASGRQLLKACHVRASLEPNGTPVQILHATADDEHHQRQRAR
ncbi:hypothetical protein M8494_23565 [Serratia ureilytica]